MRLALIIVAALAAFGATGAAEALSIGVSAPLSGPSAILGKQVEAGARLAAAARGVSLTVADDACTAEGGAAAARAFAAAKVDAVVGFLCNEAIEAALPILKGAGIPAITVGVRTDSLTDNLANGRDKTGWPVLRLAPRGDAERQAAADMVTRLWRDDFFAIVDDGTIYGRELAEAVRAGAEQSGLKPVFVDTFRPAMDNQIGLVGRLRKAGATHVFVGGDGSDLAIMARDAGKLGAGMVFAGGESLRIASGDVAYAQGTLMVALPEWSDVADKTALDAFAAAKIVPEGYALPAYAAVEIATEAGAPGQLLTEALKGRDFATAIGTIRFDGKGDLARNPYRVFRFDGQRFVPLEEK
jgi:branched-chain amino acid transport system substrate-binding protein